MKQQNLKKLPIGISTFSKIQEKNYLYIDKTKEAYNLITNYKYTFLSRPRRFGKSLFVDTLKEIFEGNKKLFEGLYIYDKWDFEEKYPVINIDFSKGRVENREHLDEKILQILKENQDNLGIECKYITDTAGCFRELIIHAYKKYNQPIVILIDEYDKPILDNIEEFKKANSIRDGLYNLYSVMKGSDRYLQFVFLTGVSKFSRASIFSGLNNIEDITLTPSFGNICGYTQNDIETTFKPYLQGVDLKELKLWYDGYNFLGDLLYNPFNILLFIKNNLEFNNYWFTTGTPTFLLKLFKEKNYNLAEFENLEAPNELLNSFDIERLNLKSVMFQSGYLTIKTKTYRRRKIQYRLTYPNLETKMSFNNYLLEYLTDANTQKSRVQNGLVDMLEVANLDGLEQVIKSLFASIAYNNFVNNNIQDYEGFYASVIYAYFAGTGFDKIIAEDATNIGRIDLSVFIEDKVYIFEFKVDQLGALAQIKSRNYHQKYLNDYNEIYIVGVEFDSSTKNVVGYQWERIK